MGLTKISIALWSILFWVAALHGFYLAVIFAIRKENKATNRLFSLILFLFSFHLTNYLLFLSELIRHVPHFLSVQRPLLYLIGPSIYLYIRSQVGRPVKLQVWTPLHFAPAIFFLIRKIPVYMQSADFKLNVIQKYFSGLYQPSFLDEIVSLAYLMHILFYLALSYWAIERKSLRRMAAANAADAIINGTWRKMIVIYAVLLSLTLTFFLAASAIGFSSPNVELALVLILAISIHVLGYVAITQPSRLTAEGSGVNGKKYLTSPLTKSSMKQYGEQLLGVMKSEKPYLNADLTVTDLATKINIPGHHLSQLLTQELRTSFYDFVNEFRVLEAKSRLKDKKYSNYKISAIAFDVGFRSKMSFNRTFKKKTGLTPSDYRNR